MKLIKMAAAAFAATLALVACSDKDLDKRVTELEGRVEAIEKQIGTVNENITAISRIISGNAIVASVENNGSIYTLHLLDGSTLVVNKSTNTYNVPQVSVSDDGFWRVSYDNGTTWNFVLDKDGKKVSTSPQIGINDKGEWTVNGISTGVKAEYVNSGSEFFTDVVFADGQLSLTLADGKVVKIPVVENFSCAIFSDSACSMRLEYADPQVFAFGASKVFYVQFKGAETVSVTAPQGWSAVLEEFSVKDDVTVASLTVKAPLTTKAILADSSKDLVVTAVSAKGYNVVTKIMVVTEAAPEPTVSVLAGDPTFNSLNFSVSLSNAVKYYYSFVQASEPDLTTYTAEYLKANGTESAETSLAFNDLTATTSYVLYVVAENGDGEFSSVKAIPAATIAKQYANLYDAYCDGADVTIGGKVLNKATNGEATLIETSGALPSSNGVYFLKKGVDVTYDLSTAIEGLAVIGLDPANRNTISATAQYRLNNVDMANGFCVFANVVFNYQAVNNYAFTVYRDGRYGLLSIVDSEIVMSTANKPLLYVSNTSPRSIENFELIGCDIALASAQNQYLFNIGTNPTGFGSITVKNSVFFCKSGLAQANFIMINAQGSTIDKLVFENNTFANVWGSTSFMVYANNLTEYIAKNNVFVTDQTVANNAGLFRAKNASGSPLAGNPVKGEISGNIYFAGANTYSVQAIFGGIGSEKLNATGFSSLTDFTKLDASPFASSDYATGKFTMLSEYASCGATR